MWVADKAPSEGGGVGWGGGGGGVQHGRCLDSLSRAAEALSPSSPPLPHTPPPCFVQMDGPLCTPRGWATLHPAPHPPTPVMPPPPTHSPSDPHLHSPTLAPSVHADGSWVGDLQDCVGVHNGLGQRFVDAVRWAYLTQL